LSNLDIFTGKINLYEYQQVYYHNPTTYDNIENFMSIYKPIEVIFIYNVEDSLIDQILHYLKTSSKKITRVSLIAENHFKDQASRCENQVYQNELIRTFYPNIDVNHLLEKTIAFQALCFLLNYVSQHNANLTQRLKEPHIDTCDVLVLANHSLKQLNILDGDYSGEYSSVLKLLNICKTRIGQREMERIILKPTRNVKYLQDSYDMIEHSIGKYNWPNLSQIRDIEKIIRKMFLSRATPLDYFYLYDACNIIKCADCDPRLSEYIHFPEAIQEILLIQTALSTCLNMDVCKTINSLQFEGAQHLIVRGYNLELDEIIDTTFECESKIAIIVKYLNDLYSTIDKKTKDAVKIHETSTISFLITKKRGAALDKKIKELQNKIVEFPHFTFDLSKLQYKDNNSNTEIVSKPSISVWHMTMDNLCLDSLRLM
jgi:DNA mismatch repair ATPase MutS